MSIPSEPPPASLSRRVVLLGASNVARGLSTLVETACRLWGRPLDLLAACGHGRSYGWRMSLLGRALPGIVDCGLWQALEQAPPAPTGALVTDVGNDILYDVPVDAIAAWVEACLGRLARAGARVVMTPLPLGNIATLSPARYLFFRRLLFPRCRLPYSAARERVLDLDGRLRALARSHGAHLAEHRPEWYGLDPIHIRRRHAAQAWRAILSPWADASPLPPPATGSLRRWLYVRRLPPDRRWLFGREQRGPQPAGRFADGSTLALY
jgi:hypothetical protein